MQRVHFTTVFPLPTSGLPVEDILPALNRTLETHRNVVLQAPPGAGKTTLVPLSLLDASWLHTAGSAGQKIIMLEPRRLATRAAAQRMAALLGERVGETVGYRIRRDQRVGPTTRIEIVTEGILTRLIQADPTLDGVGAIIFDEFHERNLHADLGLALALQSQSLVRDDLRVIVMSATLDSAPIAALLGNAPVLTSEGKSYPVALRYADRPPTRIENAVAAAIWRSLTEDPGDILVFLPGAGEIRRVETLLHEHTLPAHVHVYPLFGNLPQELQDAAIAPSGPSERKIVLATSIAETSLTIEGIRVVIDSGLMRVPRFSSSSGMARLETVRVSRASADQRCGRAGRLVPGVCYRVWPEHEQHHLVPHGTPEIRESDLTPLALELAVAGIDDPTTLAWLDAPPPVAYAHARILLQQLRALDADYRVTDHGRAIAALGVHPRLAHMMLEAHRLGWGNVACDIAAVLGERDFLRTDSGVPDADLRIRLEMLYGSQTAGNGAIDRATLHRVRDEAKHWKQRLRITDTHTIAALDVVGAVLAFAYPDRIAQRRSGAAAGRFLLRNGRGAAFATPQTLSTTPYIVAASVDGKQADSRILLAAPIDLEEIQTYFGDQIDTVQKIVWDPATESVRAHVREQLGAIVLAERSIRHPDPDAVCGALLDGLARVGMRALPWTEHSRNVQARLQFLHHHDPNWPDVSDDQLAATLSNWLAPHITGIRSVADLQKIDLSALLLESLDWKQRVALDERAPSHYTVPTGSRIAIDYSTPETPVLAVRLQEMFGLADTPRIDRGRIPLTLHLLSPARRPVQVTQDLAGFWERSYFDVRKELKGRYPKHVWPDNPLHAEPTRRTKRHNS